MGRFLRLLHSLFEVDDRFGGFVEFLVKKYVELAGWVIKEILNKAAIVQIAVDIQLVLPVDHILVRVAYLVVKMLRISRNSL